MHKNTIIPFDSKKSQKRDINRNITNHRKLRVRAFFKHF